MPTLELDVWLPLVEGGVNCAIESAILRAGQVQIDYGNIVPDIFSDTQTYWTSDLPAGTYLIEYVEGTMEYAPCVIPCWSVNTAGAGFRVVHSNNLADVLFPASEITFATEALAMAANIGKQLLIGHAGGTISMYLLDAPYADNVPGTPTPTFHLTKVG